MAQDKSFEERLKRLGTPQTEAERTFAEKPASFAPQPTMPKGPSAFGEMAKGLLCVFALLVAALGGVYYVQQYKITGNPMNRLASAYHADVRPPELGGPSGLFAHSNGENNYHRSCLRFLPPAPEGWVRVNTWDVRYPDLMATLETIWLDNGKVLKDSRGFDALNAFVIKYDNEDVMNAERRNGKGLSSALYFNVVEDRFMQADFHFTKRKYSPNCAKAFVAEWEERDGTQAKRHPILDRFNIGVQGRNMTATSQADRQKGLALLTTQTVIGKAVVLEVKGVLARDDIRNVMNVNVSTLVADAQEILAK